MTGRGPIDAQPGYSLPVFDRLAPAPSPAVVAARIDQHTGPGDVVADLFGRGGWVGRAAVDRQRRTVSLESSPLTRMLAEVVLRPPDVRHLDAAFQGLAASPRRESSLKVSIGDLFATRCATCSRSLVIDEIIWAVDDEAAIAGRIRPVTRLYRCAVCRDQRGGTEQRQAPLDADDLRRATAEVGAAAMRSSLLARFPEIPGAETLPDELLDLHTDRQLVGLGAILERIEMDLRAAPVMAALRLALLHAILPASRLGTGPGRRTTLRVASGHVRPSSGTQFRERNPWLAFEDAFRTVRGFIQRLDAGAHGPVQARLGEDLRSLGEGAATAFVGLTGPTGFVGLRDDPNAYGRTAPTPRIRLILGQPPMRPNLERLAAAYHATSWVLGREAAALLPLDGLAGASLRGPWAVQATSMAGALEAVEPAFARDGRVVWLVDGGPEATVATALGGASAGYRLLGARLADPDDDAPAVVEQISPGGPAAAGVADARQRRARAAAGRSRRPGRGPVAQPVRAAGGVRRQAVLGGGDGPGGDGGRGRDAPRPGRARPLRAAAGRDPGRARPVRAAPAVRDGDAAAGERGSGRARRHEPGERAERDGGRRARARDAGPPIPRRRTRTAHRRPETTAPRPRRPGHAVAPRIATPRRTPSSACSR